MTPFDDREVVECAVRVTGAGDGLSESLSTAPVELHHGDDVYLVLRCKVAKVTHEAIKDSDELRRVHVVRATFGTLVDEASVRKTLDAARRQIEQASGVQRIPGTDDE